QTYSYSRHFISSCTRVLGLESTPTGVDYHGTHVAINIFPIGVDVATTERFRRSDGVLDKMSILRKLYAGKLIIVGRDRLDPVKGIVHKLNAFEKFLERYPEWQGRVVLVQVTTPGRVPLPKLEKNISETVARINGLYGSIEFIPVHYYRQQIDRDEYLALLSVAQVALITSIRDGMNTTSYEYVLCQHNGDRNPLILSEFAGTAGSLSAAILVNPWDYVGVADAINEALTMSAEDKNTKHQHLYNHVATYTAEYWARAFVRELRANLRMPGRGGTTPLLDGERIRTAYTQATGRRLLMFDYDGTLTSIRKVPGAAVPSAPMVEALTKLAADPRNDVWVISGRDQPTLERWLGDIPKLGLSAEHGCFIRHPGQAWINLLEQDDFSWKKEVSEIFDYYTERTQGSFIEHKSSSITWHYRLADPAFGEFQAKECQNHLENAVLSKLPVEILVGKKNLEVRPVSINKGGVVSRLVSDAVGPSQEPAPIDCGFLICAGDDKTDEDMFRAIRRDRRLADTSNVYCVTIGEATKKTAANWHVPTPADLIDVLRGLAGFCPVPADAREVGDDVGNDA
ncbi:glycosyltransferase family 20-domain-containing protein, partial [Thamnocephalis sphaerospora]